MEKRGIEVFSVVRTLSFGPLIMREGSRVTVTRQQEKRERPEREK